MKVAVICLAYGREDLTAKTLAENLPSAGVPFSLFIVNKTGIAHAMNEGLLDAYSKGYEAFCFLANDIIEPKQWLKKRVEAMNETSGMISYPVDNLFDQITFCDVVGNVLISRKVVDTVGYFNESFGEYGPIDNDYNRRCEVAGFRNFYLPFFQAIELHPHGSEQADNIYGYSKKERISQTWATHCKDSSDYLSGVKPFKLDPPKFPDDRITRFG